MHPGKSRALFPGLLAALLLGTFCAAALADTIRILPLGDSITQADAGRASYRYPLWQMLVDSELEFDFVGSLQKHQGEHANHSPPQPDYKGQSFDRDHEGHFGWTVDEILNGRGFVYGPGKLAEWVAGYDADIALVHLGTNDAFKGQSNESTIDELKEVIRILREDNPRITILLARLIPVNRNPGDADPIESLNAAIPRVAEAMHTEQSPVIIVDHASGFDPESDTYDGVHPNVSGERKMARRWFDAIMDVVQQD